MGGLKTSVMIVMLATGPLPVMAAQPTGPDESQLRIFASCTGRVSALREFQWNSDTPASERTSARLAQFIDLLEAIITPDSQARALAWRVEAKAAQRGLLNDSRYRKDPRLSAQASAFVDNCLKLLP